MESGYVDFVFEGPRGLGTNVDRHPAIGVRAWCPTTEQSLSPPASTNEFVARVPAVYLESAEATI
jgi:hypothetical protein